MADNGEHGEGHGDHDDHGDHGGRIGPRTGGGGAALAALGVLAAAAAVQGAVQERAETGPVTVDWVDGLLPAGRRAGVRASAELVGGELVITVGEDGRSALPLHHATVPKMTTHGWARSRPRGVPADPRDPRAAHGGTVTLTFPGGAGQLPIMLAETPIAP